MAELDSKMEEKEMAGKEAWQKHVLTKTTNGTYGQFYQFKKLLEAQQEDKPDWHTHNHEYGKFDETPTAGFKTQGGKSPELRYGLGFDGETGQMGSEQQEINKNELQETYDQNEMQPEADDRMLRLPPVDEKFLPKAGQSGRTWIKQEPLPTPGTWWSKESPRLQRPNPPTTGYAKKYMQNECTRMWENMEYIAGRGTNNRLNNYEPDILDVTASQQQNNDNPTYGDEYPNTNCDDSYADILAKYNIK